MAAAGGGRRVAAGGRLQQQHREGGEEEEGGLGLVHEELESVSERVRHSIVTDIPVLERAAEYFFRAGQEGKRLRSSVLLLLASTLSPTPPLPTHRTPDLAPASAYAPELRRRQQRLAEITELIHVASLLHDDVIDGAETRRGLQAVNVLLGNKVRVCMGGTGARRRDSFGLIRI
jgi:geranyl diphosphate synthase